MDSQKIKVYSISSTYPDSPNSIIHFFVHTINKELAKLNVSIKAITPHSKGALSKELMDKVLIKRFRYLPEKYEINLISIAEVVNESKGGFFKVVILTLNFFIFTFFECLKDKPDIFHGHWALPGGFIAIVMSKIFRKKSVAPTSCQSLRTGAAVSPGCDGEGGWSPSAGLGAPHWLL